jgi:hypothetical protein
MVDTKSVISAYSQSLTAKTEETGAKATTGTQKVCRTFNITFLEHLLQKS